MYSLQIGTDMLGALLGITVDNVLAGIDTEPAGLDNVRRTAQRKVRPSSWF